MLGAGTGTAVAFYSDPELSELKQIRFRKRCSLFAFSKGKLTQLIYIEI